MNGRHSGKDNNVRDEPHSPVIIKADRLAIARPFQVSAVVHCVGWVDRGVRGVLTSSAHFTPHEATPPGIWYLVSGILHRPNRLSDCLWV